MRTLAEILPLLSPQKRAFIIGSAFVDMVINVHEMPHAGADVEGEYRKTVVGGCSFNVADVLYKLGLPFESYMPVGEGEFSAIVERALRARNYPVYREKGAGDNGWCLSIADHTGERTFISMFGLERKMRHEWFERFDLASYDYLYVSGYQAEGENGAVLLDVLAKKAPHALIVFDPGPRVTALSQERIHAFETLGCLYTVNADEACLMTESHSAEEAACKLFERSGHPAVVTDGARGAVLAEMRGGKIVVERIPGFPIRLVDTIGSGDAHTGGVLAGLLCGLSMQESVLLANAVAAHVSASEGAATAPTRTELAHYE